jgi:hypothetical protein
MPNSASSRLGLVRRGLRFLVIFLVAIALFIASLTAVFALPQGRIIKNLKTSLALLESEGRYPRLVMGQNNVYRLDNYDDAHWMDIAIVTEPGGPLVNAMAMYQGSVDVPNNPIALLARDLAAPREAATGYSYYWHGYQLFLRPALIAFSYGEIRYINILMMGMLASIVALLVARKAGELAAGVFVFALLLSGFWAIPLTINHSSDAYLMLIGSLVVLLWADRPSFRTLAVEAFFVLGMLTAFFDNATNPLITLGVPLGIALIVFARTDPLGSPARDVGFAAKTAVAWVVGYVGSWVSKWLVGTVVLGHNVVRDAIAQIAFRTGGSDAKPQQFDAIAWNLRNLFPLVRENKVTSGLVLLMLVLGVGVVLLVWFRRPASQIRRMLPVLVVAPLPFAYYAAASNLTLIHNWISYRTLAITVFAVTYFALAAVDFEALGRRLGLAGALGIHDLADSEGGDRRSDAA